jgi:S-DNA-T family DNA segregation ATPase FtsK/SpoIIIE
MMATGVFLVVALWPLDPASAPASSNLVGELGAWIADLAYDALGLGASLVGAMLVVWGGLIFFERGTRQAVLTTLSFVAAAWVVLSMLGVVAMWGGQPDGWTIRAGRVGVATAAGLTELVGIAGAVLVGAVSLALLAVVTFHVSLASGVDTIRRRSTSGLEALRGWRADRRARRSVGTKPIEPPLEPREATVPSNETQPESDDSAGDDGSDEEQVTVPRPAKGSFLPPVTLLDPAEERDPSGQSREDVERLGEVLIEKLDSFHVKGQIDAIHTGPVLSQFEVKPAPGVKVNQIANLADDLALAMRAERIRVVAPIPGRGAVGIEVPNSRAVTVTMREMLESQAWDRSSVLLPLALGLGIRGDPVVADLARMPHLLIAGATGSGKSVCIHTIVTSLIYRYGPETVRFIMIDPKMLELVAYNPIPHLLHPVVVDHRESAKALKWVVAEMERRYKLLAAGGIRSIGEYNARLEAGELGGDEENEVERRPLPFIVVLVDELADLMLTVQHEIEEPLARLAQMARAVGIHLVLATQRPSVNVITGVIKANFPSRISFQVSSKIDSRTVLDMNGAEQLLGRGDMLFLPSDRAEPWRLQGAFISTSETSRVVEYLEQAAIDLGAGEVAPPVDIIAEASELETAVLHERDELFLSAARVVIQHEQGSTSLLQRRLRVGYSRAARILDQLEQAGVVGPPEGTKPREVRMTMDELENLGPGGFGADGRPES